MEELAKVILKEETVLEKTDVASGVIVERITVVTDYHKGNKVKEEITNHEFFDLEGNPIKTVEGGKDATN